MGMSGGPAHWRPPVGRFEVPRLPSDFVDRDELAAAVLASVDTHLLTLLSAPAGFGKTTLAATVVRAIGDRPVAWLSLDADDDDPLRLATNMTAAIDHAIAGPPGGTPMARSAGMSARQIIDRALEGVGTHPLVLALDEAQVLDSADTHSVLDYLLDVAPSSLNVLVASRRDPPLALARLRARGALGEFRTAELRFTPDHASEFLTGAGHALHGTSLAAVHARLEGWPAGYRLLRVAFDRLRPGPELEGYLAALEQSDRFAAEFLIKDVLEREPESVRQALLDLSVLSEITPELCSALTGTTDAPRHLADLEKRNLFLTRVDASTYRFHGLFGQLLAEESERRDPARVSGLHRRAAQTLAVDEPERAIHHHLAARCPDEAAALIGEAGIALLREGFTTQLDRWLKLMPPDALEHHPRLVFLSGAVLFERGDATRAVPVLRRAAALLETAGDPAGQGRALAFLATAAVWQDQVDRAAPLLEQALTLPLDPPDRVSLLLGRARLTFLEQRWVESQRDVADAIQIAADHDEPGVLYSLLYLHPVFFFLPRGLELIERACALVTARLGEVLPMAPIRVLYAGLSGFAHLMRGDLDRALAFADDGLAVIRTLDTDAGALAVTLGSTAVSVHAAHNNADMVDMLLQMLMFQAARAGVSDAQMPGALFLLGKLRWIQGDTEEARILLDRMAAAVEEGTLPGAPAMHSMLTGLLSASDQQGEAALEALRRAVRFEREGRASLLFGSARPLLAHIEWRLGRSAEALRTLDGFLTEIDQRGTPGLALREGPAMMGPLLRLAIDEGVHVSLARRLLTAMGEAAAPHAVEVPGTDEHLTPREIEVLTLVAAGWSNQHIADELVVSVHTVKRHVANLLTKLGADSRSAAAARARSLGIV